MPEPTIPQHEALQRLIAVASRNDSGQARRIADFLLAWWHAAECGRLDLTDLWGLDDALKADVITVFAAVVSGQEYPDTLGYAREFERLIALWRPELHATTTPAAEATALAPEDRRTLMEDLLERARPQLDQQAAALGYRLRGRHELPLPAPPPHDAAPPGPDRTITEGDTVLFRDGEGWHAGIVREVRYRGGADGQVAVPDSAGGCTSHVVSTSLCIRLITADGRPCDALRSIVTEPE
jgi:hypothetical protein